MNKIVDWVPYKLRPLWTQMYSSFQYSAAHTGIKIHQYRVRGCIPGGIVSQASAMASACTTVRRVAISITGHSRGNVRRSLGCCCNAFQSHIRLPPDPKKRRTDCVPVARTVRPHPCLVPFFGGSKPTHSADSSTPNLVTTQVNLLGNMKLNMMTKERRPKMESRIRT